MAERTNEIEKTESKGVKRKNSEPQDTAGSSKIAKTELEPKPEQLEKKEVAETEKEPKTEQLEKKEVAETEKEPKTKQTEKKPTLNPIEKLAEHFRIKVEETVSELINPTNDDDFDGPETLRRLEYYVFMAKVNALKAGIPCSFEFKINLIE